MSKKEFEKMLGRELQDEAYRTVEYVMTWHPVFSGDPQSAAQKAVNIITSCGIDVLYQMVETAEYMEAVSREKTDLIDMMNSVERRMEQVAHGNLSEERCRKEVAWMYSKARSQGEWMYFVSCLESRHGKQMTDRVIEDLGLGRNAVPSMAEQDKESSSEVHKENPVNRNGNYPPDFITQSTSADYDTQGNISAK